MIIEFINYYLTFITMVFVHASCHGAPNPLKASKGSRSTYIAGIVNRTWNINESIPGASDVSLTLQWEGDDELGGIARNTSYLSHYTLGSWNNGIQMSANRGLILIHLANHDNNQHAENENIRVGNLFDGIETMGSLMMIK